MSSKLDILVGRFVAFLADSEHPCRLHIVAFLADSEHSCGPRFVAFLADSEHPCLGWVAFLIRADDGRDGPFVKPPAL
jgi:hypothetical protein